MNKMDEERHNKEVEFMKRRQSITRRDSIYQKERRKSDGRITNFVFLSTKSIFFPGANVQSHYITSELLHVTKYHNQR